MLACQEMCILKHTFPGTFGQPDPWDIYNKDTHQHPMVPYDVLVDPQSLPEHPVISDKKNTGQVVHEDSARNSDTEEVRDARTQLLMLDAVCSPTVKAPASFRFMLRIGYRTRVG